MKILYAITAYPPSTGGAQTHFARLAGSLAARHHVRVVCHWRENRTDWLRGVTLRAPGDEESIWEGIPVSQLNLSSSERRALAPWVYGYYLAMGTAVRRISDVLVEKLDRRTGDIDLVHAGRVGREFLAWAAYKLARRRKVPFVFTPFHHPKWSGWRWRWHTRLYQKADAVFALTHAEKNALSALGVDPGKISVIGHGPVLAAGTPQANYFSPGGPVILFLGQKYQYKGLEQLLRAMPLVWRDRPDARFAFLGPETSYSRNLFRGVFDSRVITKDKVPEVEKLAALAGCAIFCLPSRQESFGGVFLEAWLQGKPVIGGNIPAISEIVQSSVNGEVVGESPSDLANVILKLIRDPDLARKMGQRGKDLALSQFTWDAISGKVEKIYQGLATRAGQ